MRIHTNTLNSWDVDAAITKARAYGEVTEHKSRTHTRAFDVKLTGSSRRRPNSGGRGAGDDYAATWDQWGVFLGALFDQDPTIKTRIDDGAAAFYYRTDGRFDNLGDEIPFPLDHDHRFVVNVPGMQECAKPECDAVSFFRGW